MKTTIDDKGNTRWHFTRAELAALLAHMSRDVTRPGMCCLILDTSLGRAWSTDGHRACIARTGARVEHDRAIAVKGPIMVPRAALETVQKAAEVVITPHVSGGKLIDIRRGLEDPVETREPEGATAPNIDYAAPPIGKDHRGISSSFSGRYLEDANLVVKALPMREHRTPKKKVEKRPEALTIHPPESEYKPVTITAASIFNQTEWTILIMPVRA